MERPASAQLFASVGLEFQQWFAHRYFDMVGDDGSLLLILLAIKPAQFKGDEAIGQRFHLSSGRFSPQV